MTLGEPKWFADDAAALHDYLGARLATYPTARAIEECPSCAPGSGGATTRASASTSTKASVSPAAAGGVEASAHRLLFPAGVRVTYGPKQGTAAHRIRSQLQVRQAGAAQGEEPWPALSG